MINLSDISTLPPHGFSKSDVKAETVHYQKEIARLQEILYAQGKYSILIVLQGMDTSGKSSTIRDVFKYVNPMGLHIKSYKKPTDDEFAHDFLWRVHPHVPGKGMISIFDRSHYEDILIQRVHKWIDEDHVKQRMRHINNFEDLIATENNTTILKFYLHISYENQLVDLKERETDPTKRWKFNPDDYKEREHWPDYMKAYEDVFEHCSPKFPWQIIPADKGWYKRYLVAKSLYETLSAMDLEYPV